MSENRMTPHALATVINRRETRSPRSTLAITLAVLIIVASAYTVGEVLLQITGHAPILMSVGSAARELAALGQTSGAGAIGAAISVLGVLVIVTALSPGRRAKHTLEHHHSAIVDNAVIASALARHAARAGQIGADSVRVSVSHRNAEVRITPASGSSVDYAAVAEAVQEQIARYRLSPSIQAKVIVEDGGRVGA